MVISAIPGARNALAVASYFQPQTREWLLDHPNRFAVTTSEKGSHLAVQLV